MQGAGLVHLVTEPTKAALLGALVAGDRTVTELVAVVGAEQSNISHHLRALRQAGLVAARHRGRERHYHLADPAVRDLLAALEALGADLQRVTFFTRLQLPVDTTFHGYG
jgi:DNA-binding transcriptional ArsR family regulator